MAAFNGALRYRTFAAPSLPLNATAQAISQIASPPALTIGAIALIASAIADVQWTWTIAHALLSSLAPALYVGYLLYRGQIADLHLNVRSERMRPLRFSLACGAASLLLLIAVEAHSLLVVLALLNIVQVALFLGITARWKISAHSASAAGLSSSAVVLFGEMALPLLFLVPVVAWARIYLSRHTPAQTLAGALLGVLLWSSALLAYGV